MVSFWDLVLRRPQLRLASDTDGFGELWRNICLHFQDQLFLVTTFLSFYIKRRQTLVDLGKEQKQLPFEGHDIGDPVTS